MNFWKILTIFNVLLASIVIAVVVCRAKVHNEVTSSTTIKESGNSLIAGNASEYMRSTETDLRDLTTKSIHMCYMSFHFPAPEIEASLLQVDLPKQLSKIRRSSNHVLQVRKRCLSSDPERRELRRIQQADRATERH